MQWAPHILEHSDELGSTPGMLEAKLKHHMQMLRTLKAQVQGDLIGNVSQYPSMVLIESLRGAWLLRGAGKLRKIAHHIVNVCIPSSQQNGMHKHIDRPMVIPSRATMSRGRVSLDLGYAWCMRDILCPPQSTVSVTWWMWADSSPMGGHDWLITYIHYAYLECDWHNLASSFHELCRRNELPQVDDADSASDASEASSNDPPPAPAAPRRRLQVDDGGGVGRFLDSDSEESGVHAEDVPFVPSSMDVAELTRVIARSVCHHTFIPQALGTRAASLAHKTSCIAEQVNYEVSGDVQFNRFISGGVSGTFDLGTEYGLGDAVNADGTSHFPEFHRPAAVQSDDHDGDFPCDDDSSKDRRFFFDKMLSVAALLHIIDNATKELHKSMTDFKCCWVFLSSLMDLLCHEGPRQAFIHRVVKAGGFGHRAVHFEKAFPLHSEHRWSSLILTMKWLLPLREYPAICHL